MKSAVVLLLCAVTAFAQEVKRPSVPSATTLAQPTSQIAAWYRYAVYCEQQIAALKAAPPPATCDLAPVLAGIAELKTLINAAPTPPPTTPTLPPPVITQTPDGAAKAGTTVTLTATATGTDISWQWMRNGTAFPGWNTSTLVLPALTDNDSGVYEVVATTSGGSGRATHVITVVP